MALGSKLHYWNGATWVEETDKIKITIKDTAVGTPKFLQAYIINTITSTTHSKNAIYTPYKKIRVTDYASGAIIFLGRVDSAQSSYDISYGQILILTAKDFLQNYADRTPSSALSSGVKIRSDLIDDLLDLYNTPSNDVVTMVGSSLSNETVTRDYKNSNKTCLTVIEELAEEDPWTYKNWSVPGGAAYRGSSLLPDPYTNLTSLSSNIYYFGQPAPFAGLNLFDGVVFSAYSSISIKYFNGSIMTPITVTQNNTFAANGPLRWEVPADWEPSTYMSYSGYYWVEITLVAGGLVPQFKIASLQCVGMSYNMIEGGTYASPTVALHYYRPGSFPTFPTYGLTVSLGAAETDLVRTMLADYDFYTQGQETITQVISRGMANDGTIKTGTAPNITGYTALETSLDARKQLYDYVSGTNMAPADLQTYVDTRALNLLNNKAAPIQRGSISIIKYPYYTVGGVPYVVRAGHKIRVNCPFRGMTGYYTVSSIDYNDPDGLSKIELLSPTQGRGSDVTQTTSMLQTFKTDGMATPASKVSDIITSSGGSWDATVNTAFTSATRAYGTNHQNTSGKVLFVCAVARAIGGTTSLIAYVGASNPASTLVGQVYTSTDSDMAVTFMVPKNYYYKVESSDTWIGWSETALG